MRERLTEDQWKQRFIGAFIATAGQGSEADADEAYADVVKEGIDTEEHCPVESALSCFEPLEAEETAAVEGVAV